MAFCASSPGRYTSAARPLGKVVPLPPCVDCYFQERGQPSSPDVSGAVSLAPFTLGTQSSRSLNIKSTQFCETFGWLTHRLTNQLCNKESSLPGKKLNHQFLTSYDSNNGSLQQPFCLFFENNNNYDNNTIQK